MSHSWSIFSFIQVPGGGQGLRIKIRFPDDGKDEKNSNRDGRVLRACGWESHDLSRITRTAGPVCVDCTVCRSTYLANIGPFLQLVFVPSSYT